MSDDNKGLNSVGDKERFIAKSMTLREDQYDLISALAAYYKLTKQNPSSVSGIVREALDLYMKNIDPAFYEFMKSIKG